MRPPPLFCARSKAIRTKSEKHRKSELNYQASILHRNLAGSFLVQGEASATRPGQFPPSGFRFHQLALPLEERGAGGGMNMLFKITAIFSLLMVLPVL